MTEVLGLPTRPCLTCPYSKRTPPGVWDATEYAKLPEYDGETWEQATGIFQCHYDIGDVCAGWLACHDIEHLLAVRLGLSLGHLDPEIYEWEPADDVEVWATGAEAAEHGSTPEVSDDAQEAIDRITRHHLRKDAL